MNADAPSSRDHFFRKRHNTTVAFIAGIILFFLPFAEFKCGSTTIAENTGIGLATGADWHVSLMAGYEKYLSKQIDKDKPQTRSIPNDENWFFILALAFAVAGIVCSIGNWRYRSVSVMSAGILATLLMIGALIYMKIGFRSGFKDATESARGLTGVIRLQFTFWFYLSLLFFAAAAFFGYKHHRIEMEDQIDRVLDFEFQQSNESSPQP